MIRAVTAFIAVGAAAIVAAQDLPESVLSCQRQFPDDHARIGECVDNLVKQEQAKKKDAQEPLPEFQLRVRDSSTSTVTFGQYELGNKGATWSMERTNGDTVHVAKVGAFGYWRPQRELGGLQPFAGVSVVKQGTGDSKKDIRDVTLGAVGVVFQRPKSDEARLDMTNSFTVLESLQLTRREDDVGDAEGNIFRAHSDFVWLPLATGLLWLDIVPHAGLLFEQRTGGGPEDGQWNSAYVGLVASKTIGRLQATIVGRRLYDFRTPADNPKRRDRYASISVDYFFYDPKNKNASFQPSLFVTREVGNDFLTGVGQENKTTAGLRIKFN